jgi:hypothetical protein
MQTPFWDAAVAKSAIPFITFLCKYFSADLFAAAVEVGGGCCVILANASGPGLGIPKSPVGSAALPPILPPVPRPGGLKPPPLPCILYQKHFSENDAKPDFNQENEKLCSKTILSFTAKYFLANIGAMSAQVSDLQKERSPAES